MQRGHGRGERGASGRDRDGMEDLMSLIMSEAEGPINGANRNSRLLTFVDADEKEN